MVDALGWDQQSENGSAQGGDDAAGSAVNAAGCTAGPAASAAGPAANAAGSAANAAGGADATAGPAAAAVAGAAASPAAMGGVDWLTGLPDRQRFLALAQDACEAMLARGETPALVALDLIGLKAYNSQYGRDAGDRLLRLFGTILSSYFGTEACSRFGEDHFYAYAPERGLTRTLRALFSDFKAVPEMKTLPVRSGACVCELSDGMVMAAIDRAKIACDLDRKTWESHVVWYNDEMREEERLRIHVLEHVDQAVEEVWVRPHYQAIVRAVTGDLCGEEALARWVDPVYGALSPAQFIPVLEEAGLLHKIDMHMVACVLNDMHRKRDAGVSLVPVSVNFSHRDLVMHDIASEVARRADLEGVAHGLVRIEFTESAVTTDPALFKSQLAKLHAAGFEVWMDDFGSGYSSLNTLQEFDFDLIKLDMGFVAESDNPRTRTVVTGVVQMAKHLGMSVLAEGVETEDQAVFLENAGCGLLQGFLYSPPRPLEDVVGRFEQQVGIPREDVNEAGYWDAISKVNLLSLAAGEGRWSAEELQNSKLPAGILECRDGAWRVLRANEEYRSFLESVGMLDPRRMRLGAAPIERSLDEDFLVAAAKCDKSGDWVEIASRLEYGTGLHYRVKPVAKTDHAQAYLVSAAPAMLGAGLGVYGDVPVAYAVFRVLLNDAGTEAVGMEFVYANDEFCDWGGCDRQALIGTPFSEVFENASPRWYPYCYRAAIRGESIHDVLYSPEVGHWLNFHVAPSPVEGCCVFAYAIADEERRERREMEVGLTASDIIINAMNDLSQSDDYDTVINGTLDMMARIVHPERMRVFEVGELCADNTYEWLAPGVASEKEEWHDQPSSGLATWLEFLDGRTSVIVPDVEELKRDHPSLYEWFRSHGVKCFMSLPFYDTGGLVGYIGIDNYKVEEGVDVETLLETVAIFIGTRIVRRRIVGELEWSSTHDELTELYNRRGSDIAIERYRAADPGAPFVIALLEVDGFKEMNDRFGHVVGDEALRKLARTMSSVFPSDAVLGRNGSSEFLVMLPQRHVARAQDLFNRFIGSDFSFECEGEAYSLVVSLGYAAWPEQVDDLKAVYTLADTALHTVKCAGKSECRKYSPQMKVE